MIQRKLYKAKGIYAYLKKNKNITPTPPVEPSPLNAPTDLIGTIL